MVFPSRSPPSPAKWAYMQELGKARYIASRAALSAAVVPWGIVAMAIAYDGPVLWAALPAALVGALGGWSNGYTTWLIAECAYDRAALTHT